MSEGRAKRACTARAKQPSSAHYVGYVEDDETPEAIMKKFEALERVQQATAQQPAGGDGGATDGAGAGAGAAGMELLTEAQLQEVFKQTSVFTVKSATAGPESMYGHDGHDDDDAYRSDEEWDEDEFNVYADVVDDEDALASRKRRAPQARGAPSAPREPKPQKHIITAYNRDNQMLLRRKKVVDPYELVVLKLPPPTPLPASWGRMIQPFCPAAVRAQETASAADMKHILTPDVLTLDLPKLGTEFLGVLLNPPWASVTPKQIESLSLPKLCPVGFIFVWVEKEVLDQVVDVLVRQKYVYVENLTWVLMTANNRVVQGAAPFTGRSHRTLLIFRRDVREFPKGKEIELRHQRSPDVEVQIANSAADGRLLTPAAAYKAIETLLPGGYTAGQPGRFLELWGHTEVRRPGWTHVCC